jgi:DNA repair protein SbcD/Mre11
MKLLHTSDWHLGHRLLNQAERDLEHQVALEWLLGVLDQEKIDILLIAGDIFDNANPPNSALKRYYEFLTAVKKTYCNHIVIIGGNHDSPALLNAPKHLLEQLDIHVIGCVQWNEMKQNLSQEIVFIDNFAAIAAVPFLRDRDLRHTFVSDIFSERQAQLQAGIIEHYAQVAELIQKYTDKNIPLIGMGHLFAAGSTLSDSEKSIHVGNLGQISAAAFPNIFNYIALGHLHRPQKVASQNHIRYSGSLIPLSFNEAAYSKQVLIAEFDGRELIEVKSLEVPQARKFVTFRGTWAEVYSQISHYKDEQPAWGEVVLLETPNLSHLHAELQQQVKVPSLDILRVSFEIPQTEENAPIIIPSQQLEELTPLDIFRHRCQTFQKSPDKITELEILFQSVLDDINSSEKIVS